jgi:hypothetical protein
MVELGEAMHEEDLQEEETLTTRYIRATPTKLLLNPSSHFESSDS